VSDKSISMKRADIVLKLLSGRLARFDQSRNNQLRLNTVLWGAMVVVVGFLMTNDIRIHCGALLVSYFVIFFIHMLAILNIQSALDWDRKLIKKYHSILILELKSNQLVENRTRKTKRIHFEIDYAIRDIEGMWNNDNGKGIRWLVLQLITTVTISVASVLLLCDWCYCI